MINLKINEGKLSFDIDFDKIWSSGKKAVGNLLKGL